VPRRKPQLEYHTLSVVRDGLFNTFAVTLHIGGRSSIHNLRRRHALVTGTGLSWTLKEQCVGMWPGIVYQEGLY